MTEDELVLQPFPDVYMSPRALIGMKETREPVADSEFGTAINGDTIEVPLPWVSKFEFKLTNSGKLVAMPPRNKIKRGAVLKFDSTEVDKEYVPAGFVESFVVERDLVPGSVFAHTPDGRGVAFTVSGRTITVDRTYLDGTPVSWNEPHVEVEYRLRYLVIVTATKGFGNDRTGPSQSFSIEMVEAYAS